MRISDQNEIVNVQHIIGINSERHFPQQMITHCLLQMRGDMDRPVPGEEVPVMVWCPLASWGISL